MLNRRANRCSRNLLVTGLVLIAPMVVRAGDGAADLRVTRSRATGAAAFVRSGDGAAIADASGAAFVTPDEFLTAHGALLGISDAATELVAMNVVVDDLGWVHSTFRQVFPASGVPGAAAIPVFSGVVKVHQNAAGEVISANGRFYPIPPRLSTSPTLDAIAAEKVARDALPDAAPAVDESELTIVDPGWYGDRAMGARLAWRIVLRDDDAPALEAFFIDAHNGEILDRWSMLCGARVREVHDANGGNTLPGPTVRTEGGAATGIADADAAYDYAGDTYDYYLRAFNRDGLDNAGRTMIATVRSTAPTCPNAFWNGNQTVYCAGMAADDVIGHEFTHGITQFTAGLIYQNQSGQLNESYSDIFGEMVDLFNGNAAFVGPPGGTPWPTHGTGPGLDTPNNARSVCSPRTDYPDGRRWLVCEDCNSGSITGAIRDMWDPTCRNHPDRASSPLQTCSSTDSGGVHSGSGVPNHAFAMLTDGKTFNGFTVTGIGPIKAAAVWYRALTVYLTPASDFEDAYAALNQAATDLVGTTPRDPRTGLPSAGSFTASDAVQVNNALLAVEMNTPGACGAADDVLLVGPAPVCAQRTTIFADNFEGGVNGWTVSNSGPPTPYNWVRTTTPLPQSRAGVAWFAADARIGDCGAQDESGVHSLFSPAIALPAGTNFPMITFVHLMGAEGSWDGGNVKISVNNGAYQIIPRSAYLFNPPNGRVNTVGQGNTNPLAGEPCFTGASGAWGASVISLSGLASAGQSIRIRFDLGKDGCTGVTGWYVDDFEVFNCPDCNANGVVDQREFSFSAASNVLSPIGAGASQSFTIVAPPTAGGSVALQFTAYGDFSTATEFVSVDVNGTAIGNIYETNSGDCSQSPDRAEITVTAAAWNAAAAGGNAIVNLVASGDVTPTACSGDSYITVHVRYARTTTDCDGNGVPDTCINPGPTISEQPQSQTICAGQPVTFSVTAGGPPTLTYQWRRNGGIIAGATSSSYTIPSVTPANAGSYNVLVSNGCGSIASSAAILTVNSGVSIFTQPSNATVCAPAQAMFTVSATGAAPITYQWRQGGVNIGGATSPTIVINPTAASNAGSYDCVVTNPCGSVTSNAATLVVNEAPSIAQTPVNQTVCAGSPASFAVVANGTAPLSYQWQRNNVDVSGATSSTHSIASVTPADAGFYRCRVTNLCGQVFTSPPAQLIVNEPAMISLQPMSVDACEGQSVPFLLSASSTTLITYQWRRNGGNIPGATANSLVLNPVVAADAGNYDCVVTNACGSVTSSVAVLTVTVFPNITQQPSNANACVGDSASFSVTAAGTALTYQWQRNGLDIPGATAATLTLNPVTLADGGLYRCFVSNMCNTAVSQPADLFVSLRADANCDGVVNNFDIDAFVLAVSLGQGAWESAFGCNFICANDIDRDGLVNNFDIDPFVVCLTSGCP